VTELLGLALALLAEVRSRIGCDRLDIGLSCVGAVALGGPLGARA
jgi:hypothetical protein